MKTYNRASVYLMGVSFGLLIYEWKQGSYGKINRAFEVVIESLGLRVRGGVLLS